MIVLNVTYKCKAGKRNDFVEDTVIERYEVSN